MNGLEGVGEAVTGGMMARAVEPAAGEGHGHDAHCLNCKTALVGDYCHCCGQAGHVHRSLGAFWHDLLHGVLHFEGKIWRTLPLLAWRPGELTRRYLAGERARFVSPMALFLFSVFLMFAAINSIGGPVGAGDFNTDKRPQDIEKDRAELIAKLGAFEKQRAAAAAQGQSTATLDETITETKQGIAVLNSVQGKPMAEGGGEFLDIDTDPSMGWFDKVYRKAKENPSLLFYKLQSNAYKFSWALIPISVPFVWLLFLWRRGYRMYDHTVFVTYSLAFMTMLVVAATLLRLAGLSAGWGLLALTLIPPVHMYRQLRGAYRLSRFSALWRSVALVVFANVALSLFILLLVLLGVL